jgi:predicted RNA binding protein YcfA (HicA-like mRNA interferase family)
MFMPNGVFNWTFTDVVDLLKENGFRLNHARGSHFYYIGVVNKIMRQVCVPKHGNLAIKPRTLKSMVEQSGLDKKIWGL